MKKEKLSKKELIESAKEKGLYPEYLDEKYIEQARKSYVSAVREVYDDSSKEIINLMNGVAKEESQYRERLLNDAISNLSMIPDGFAKLINIILNTTYTNDDFKSVVEQDVLSGIEHLKEYIENTKQEKRKLTEAEEVRKELDEARATFEELQRAAFKKTMQPIQVEEEKITIWQKIKRFFSCKKDR